MPSVRQKSQGDWEHEKSGLKKVTLSRLVDAKEQTCFRATVFGDDALCFFLKVSKTFH